MTRTIIGPALLSALLLAACSAPPTVIDGSTPERFRTTTESARRDLSVKDRLAFDAALKHPPGSRFTADRAAVEERARTTYNGMTAEQIVALTR